MKKLELQKKGSRSKMKLSKIFKNTILVLIACLALTACATKKTATSLGGQIKVTFIQEQILLST